MKVPGGSIFPRQWTTPGADRESPLVLPHDGGASRMIALEGCGHVPHREREAEVSAHVATLLRDPDSTPLRRGVT
jgi:hypothetical protein